MNERHRLRRFLNISSHCICEFLRNLNPAAAFSAEFLTADFTAAGYYPWAVSRTNSQSAYTTAEAAQVKAHCAEPVMRMQEEQMRKYMKEYLLSLSREAEAEQVEQRLKQQKTAEMCPHEAAELRQRVKSMKKAAKYNAEASRIWELGAVQSGDLLFLAWQRAELDALYDWRYHEYTRQRDRNKL